MRNFIKTVFFLFIGLIVIATIVKGTQEERRPDSLYYKACQCETEFRGKVIKLREPDLREENIHIKLVKLTGGAQPHVYNLCRARRLTGNVAAFATRINGKMYVVYDGDYFDEITNFQSAAVLAHEMGHHINDHYLNGNYHPYTVELEADFSAGYLLKAFGYTCDQIDNYRVPDEEATPTHPSGADRTFEAVAGCNSHGNVDIAALRVPPKYESRSPSQRSEIQEKHLNPAETIKNTEWEILKKSTVDSRDTELNVRSAPNTNAKKIGSLEHGRIVKIIGYFGEKQIIGGRVGTWAAILFKNEPAYVFSGFLDDARDSKFDKSNPEERFVEVPIEAVVTTSSGDLSIRHGPGRNFVRVGEFKNGEEIQVISIVSPAVIINGNTGFWMKCKKQQVDSGGAIRFKSGYVFSHYLNFDSLVPELAILGYEMSR